jgi:hypothetical protein
MRRAASTKRTSWNPSANARAVAAPMPLDAPVMNTIIADTSAPQPMAQGRRHRKPVVATFVSRSFWAHEPCGHTH